MQSVYTEQKPRHYQLNMQVLADELDAQQVVHQFYNPGSTALLDGIRLYKRGERLQSNYVYLILPDDNGQDLRWCEEINFIIIGEVSQEDFSFTSSVIGISPDHDPFHIYNIIQDVFEKYANWDSELHWSMQSDKPLERMLAVSRGIFGNPMFIHDKDFYILACPRWMTGMLQWEREARTGREMVPLELINMFRVDDEYLASLKMRKVTMFSAGIRGYRVLFANLWQQDHYSGRICIDELERPLRKSDYFHLTHLAELVTFCMNRQNLFWMSMGSDVDRFFTNVLEGKDVDTHITKDYLRYQGWKTEDHYVVLKIISDREDYRAITPAALFGYIEAQIAECRALLFRQEIVVVVNLTASNTTTSEVLSALAYILRDGLFKIGVSSELFRFLDIRYGYSQASAALDYGKRSYSTFWYYHFRDHALQFLLDSASNIVPPHLLCSEKLRKLKIYDEENNTELYRTAETYLKLERNATLTSNELFIHRSTLFYRLSRIETVAGINFEDEQERLYLLLSFRLAQAEE